MKVVRKELLELSGILDRGFLSVLPGMKTDTFGVLNQFHKAFSITAVIL
jgi:hypothetical protein